MSKEDTEKTAKRMIEVWASTVDALLQRWLEQGKAEDRLGMALTSAKLAQVGSMMRAYFKDVCENFLQGPTEGKAANQSIQQVADMVTRAMETAGVGKLAAEGRASAREKDPSFN